MENHYDSHVPNDVGSEHPNEPIPSDVREARWIEIKDLSVSGGRSASRPQWP